jgi:hypothetical protein
MDTIAELLWECMRQYTPGEVEILSSMCCRNFELTHRSLSGMPPIEFIKRVLRVAFPGDSFSKMTKNVEDAVALEAEERKKRMELEISKARKYNSMQSVVLSCFEAAMIGFPDPEPASAAFDVPTDDSNVNEMYD